ncbi:MAG: trypsin-like peptidase domain-containing protein, partial [Pseudomonadota bacterium]
ADASQIRIRLQDRREFFAELIGEDSATDIALLRISGDDLPVAEIGHSGDVAVGDWVVAIGSPFNFENTVTAGILSARGRSFNTQQYVPFLQTDVPINRGNSGGPLLDLEGRVIGVNSQIFSENGTYMGLSFSIPIEIAMAIVSQLREAGRVDRGLLGVGIEDVTRDLALALGIDDPRGAVVTTVRPDSAAGRAGIEPWDVIVSVNGEAIQRFSDLPPRIGLIRPGTAARIGLLRAGRALDVNVVIGRAGDGEPLMEPIGGAPPDPERPERLGLDLTPAEGGLRVDAVSWREAYRAGVRENDLIISVNRQPVADRDDFDHQIEAAGSGAIALLVRRRNLTTFVALPPMRAPIR